MTTATSASPSACWRIRNCSPEVQEFCQHAVTDYDMCPATCKFAVCTRDEHKPTYDPLYVFEPNIDRAAALKHSCFHCEFFLKNGPKKDKSAPRAHEEDSSGEAE